MAPGPRTRIGVVGLGQMGRYHTQAYRAVGADIVGVCDTDPKRAAAFGAEHDLPSCTSFDELLIPLFLSGVEIQTLTVCIWNSLILEVDPTIAAVSSFLIGVTAVVLGASALLRGRGDATTT